MQSKYVALYEIITLVRNGMKLMGTPLNQIDEVVAAHIKALKRHHDGRSEYAETEMMTTGLSIRHIEYLSFNGAIVYQTPVDGKPHTTNELIEEEGTIYFPAHIIERM